MIKLVSILILLDICLTLHRHNKIDHLLQIEIQHQQSNVNNLYFENQFTNMRTLIDYTNRALTSNDTKKYQYLITKTQEMQAGLSKLKESLLTYGLPVTNQQSFCPRITTFNRTELRKYIQYNEEKTQAAVQYLASCLDCDFIKSDILEIQNETLVYNSKLNKTLDGAYCNPSKVSGEKATGVVNLNNSYFKNNLNAENWYYGSTTASDYKIYIFKRSASYNLTSCPLKAPFVNDEVQVCFNCPQGSIFNLGNQKCDTCRPDQILNIKSGKCDECLGEKLFANGSWNCKLCDLSVGEIYNKTSGKCSTCSSGSYLDTINKECVKITCSGATPRFNIATKQCEPCGPSQMIDPNDVSKCIRTNYIGICPPTSPRYDTITKLCASCPNGTVYNKSNNQCVQNPSTLSHQFTLKRSEQ